MSMKLTVWLDLDDTLWDFKGNSRISLCGLYDDYNLNRWFATVDAWIECYERHNHALWDQYNHALITKRYLQDERFKRPLVEVGSDMASEYGMRFDGEYLDRLAGCTGLVTGATELLHWLRAQGCGIGILSNGFTEVQHRKINNSGLAPLIDHVVLSDDIGVNKPDVRLYRHAEQVAGTTPGQCVMVGDNPDTDIAGAVNAGWQAILYSPVGEEYAGRGGVPTVRELSEVRRLIRH